jgi:hydrogenase/urease accessory protein HupE
MFRGIAAWLLLISASAWAHESLPAYLEIAEQPNHLYRVLWKTPAVEGAPPAIAFTAPAGCRMVSEGEGPALPGSLTRAFTMECAGGIAGRRIEIAGLPLTLLDVLVRIRRADGAAVSRILRPAEPGFIVGEATESPLQYVRLGIAHILYGIDHLLFVLGLLLIVRGARPLLKTVSAFTMAHTLTLGLATLGVVHVAPAPVEAAIALSIVFLASELALYRRGTVGLTYRHPWVVAFAFGLLHGFGFAGTLSRLGIPRAEIPKALLLFNCGVELGQVAFVLAFLAFVHSLRDLELRWPNWAQHGVSYAFGATSAYWFIQRCVSLI